MTLDDFVLETIDRIFKIRRYYYINHKLNPEQYPLEIPDENAGLWMEFFNNFEE